MNKKEVIEMYNVISDIIVAVFCFIPSGKRFRDDYHKSKLFFYKISKREEYRKLFKGFNWDISDVYPRSETFDFARERLLEFYLCWIDRVLWTEIKDLRREEMKNLFTPEEQSLLESIASEFLDEFGIKER